MTVVFISLVMPLLTVCRIALVFVLGFLCYHIKYFCQRIFFQFQTCILISYIKLSISCLWFSDEPNISIHNSETTTTSCKWWNTKLPLGVKKLITIMVWRNIYSMRTEREKQKVQGSKGTWPSCATRSKLPLMFVKLICKLFVSQVQFRLLFPVLL